MQKGATHMHFLPRSYHIGPKKWGGAMSATPQMGLIIG